MPARAAANDSEAPSAIVAPDSNPQRSRRARSATDCVMSLPNTSGEASQSIL